MKPTVDDWISLLIGIAVVVGAYWWWTNSNAEVEAAVYEACIEMGADDYSDADELLAHCDELMED